jgi:hypothetical protein
VALKGQGYITAMTNELEIVSVMQTKAGTWMVTVDGCFLGDSSPQPTKEAAVEYARKITANWKNVKLIFNRD